MTAHGRKHKARGTVFVFAVDINFVIGKKGAKKIKVTAFGTLEKVELLYFP